MAGQKTSISRLIAALVIGLVVGFPIGCAYLQPKEAMLEEKSEKLSEGAI